MPTPRGIKTIPIRKKIGRTVLGVSRGFHEASRCCLKALPRKERERKMGRLRSRKRERMGRDEIGTKEEKENERERKRMW